MVKCDSDSDEDDDSDCEYESPNYLNTKTPSAKIPEKKHTRKYAPNRLGDFNQMKTVVEDNLEKCPVCNSPAREFCDGKYSGLDMQFVIRCVSCENKCEKLRHSIKYLKHKYSQSPSKNIRKKKQIKIF